MIENDEIKLRLGIELNSEEEVFLGILARIF